MLKKLSFLAVILYLIVLYGQNLLEFGSDLRIDFYFIGMSIVTSLFAFILFKAFKNIATSYYLFMCIGEVFNQSIYNGEYSYIEIGFGIAGLVYILFEDKIKRVFKKWKK
jgi:hypothetical protein